LKKSLTLYHAIALIAYRDDEVAQRYGAEPGSQASGREVRRQDVVYPTDSGLPGTEAFAGVGDAKLLAQAVRQWMEADKSRWRAARKILWHATSSGKVPVFSEHGEIPPHFWLTHNLNSPAAQPIRFRRSDLTRLIAEALEAEIFSTDAWTPAARLFQTLIDGGTVDPVGRVMPLLRSGELTAWLGNDHDVATKWTPIESRKFQLGMTVSLDGHLTKAEVEMDKYAALANVPTGPVWFCSEDLQRVGLTMPAETAWRSVSGDPRRKEWRTRRTVSKLSTARRLISTMISTRSGWASQARPNPPLTLTNTSAARHARMPNSSDAWSRDSTFTSNYARLRPDMSGAGYPPRRPRNSCAGSCCRILRTLGMNAGSTAIRPSRSWCRPPRESTGTKPHCGAVDWRAWLAA
jgi:hypothetical protein